MASHEVAILARCRKQSNVSLKYNLYYLPEVQAISVNSPRWLTIENARFELSLQAVRDG